MPLSIWIFFRLMQTDLFDFNLPETAIAQHPCTPRDAAKMLVVHEDRCMDDKILNLADYFDEGDVLIFNNTRVIPTRLFGFKPTGGKVEIMLHKMCGHTCWQAFARPARKAVLGMELAFNGDIKGVVKEKRAEGEIVIEFRLKDTEMFAWLEQYASLPLPPYIRKGVAEEEDKVCYQTIYAKEKGAVAAPTAGLHFTPRLMEALDKKGIIRKEVTLHVGAGTFLPVKAKNIADHKMHSEWGCIPEETVQIVNEAKRKGHKVYAVGTTSLRLLESAFDNKKKKLSSWEGETDIFIYPGYGFKVIDGLLTNFHLPQSTLFMLVSAISGLERMKKAYQYAIDNHYRFYSYGDCCLLSVNKTNRI